ncbi:MAG: hypothetical protein L0G49_13520 [Luteococcus sp.]|uniref:hypothetical protein n=1 Tax=Luteococcus sp. TaxID=1969402 RepID=UPI00264788CB|nr:hypothetical protein [Luteococcus sp.]MDN5564761.1 hypothetical protein [Luteococcus sp.]
MRIHAIVASALTLPALALASAIPAQATWTPVTPKTGNRVSAQAVSFKNYAGGAPMRQVRSSSVKCTGTVISRQVVKHAGKPAGELTIYVNAKNKTTAIACFKHAGITKGKRLPTSVALISAKSATATKPAVHVVASGNFVSYAGPAAISGVKGACVQAAGAIKIGKKTVAIESPVLCDR